MSLILIIICLPFVIPIIIALKLSGEGHIWYFQERVGYKNSSFYIWKFATMLKDSPNIGAGKFTLMNDPRVTTVGKFLRKSKINEIPQLINVLLGNMSLVGPRPQIKAYFDLYPKNMQAHIYNSIPGMTGIGSIVFRNEEKILSKSDLPIKEFHARYITPYKGELELWYNQNKSFWTDTKILILTIWKVFLPDSQILYHWFPCLPEKPEGLHL